MSGEGRSTYLPLSCLILLDHAARVVNRGFGSPCYLVGSCLERADYRDVDVRTILSDEDYASLFGERVTLWPLVCLSISEYLSRASKLPVDYQVQSQTEANEFPGFRNPLVGGRDYAGYVHRRMSSDCQDEQR